MASRLAFLLLLGPARAVALGAFYSVTTLAGGNGGTTSGAANGVGTLAFFNQPFGVIPDSSGILYVVDGNNAKVRRIGPGANVTTYAGGGVSGATAGTADGTGTVVGFGTQPNDIAVSASSIVYVVDTFNQKIRTIAPNGTVTTFAGTGAAGSIDGVRTSATFNAPRGIAIDSTGKIYIADATSCKVRTITGSTVATLAGSGAAGFADGPALSATFANGVAGVAVDSLFIVYVADSSNSKVRKITGGATVTTLAGGGATGTLSGSVNGVGTNALFGSNMRGIAVDADFNVFVADRSNHRIRLITPSGLVTTLVGASLGSANGLGTNALFSTPNRISIDSSGTLYIADTFNHLIRVMTPLPICLAGYFCNGGSITSCPEGTFCPANATAPTPCVVGMYCPINSAVGVCPAGYFCATFSSQVLCPTGSYCPVNSAAPTSCPANFTTAFVGASSISTCVRSSSITTPGAAAASPGSTCFSNAACASAACRGGFCCSNSSALLGCSSCAPSNGACLAVNPGDSCASPLDCATRACLGGCCCSLAASQTAGCTTCRCAASTNASTAATAGACTAPAPPAAANATPPCNSTMAFNASGPLSRVIAFPAAANVSGASPLVFLPASSPLNAAGIDLVLASAAACAAYSAAAAATQCTAATYALASGTYFYFGTAAALGMTATPGCSA